MELKLVVQRFSLLSHGEKFKRGIFFDLLISYIVLLHVNLGTFEVFDIFGVLADFMESCNGFLVGSVISSVHQDEDFFFATTDLRHPGLAYNLEYGSILFFGDRRTLVEGSQFIV